MWYALHHSLPKSVSTSTSSLHELVHTLSRHMILALGGIYLAVLVGTAFYPDENFTVNVWVIFPLIFLPLLAAWLVLPAHFTLSQILVQSCLAAAILTEIYISRQPALLLALITLPYLSFISLGWPGGLVSISLAFSLVVWVNASAWMPSVPPVLLYAVMIGIAISGLLAWTTIQAVVDLVSWTVLYYENMRSKLEDARNQHLELQQVKEDLIKANQELTRLSDRLNKMYEVAEEARQIKEQFVANVSHELRTPLNMIIGFSKMIIESPQVYRKKLPPALLNDISAIHSNSQHLSRLVDDVLDLSQIDSDRMALSKNWISLTGVVQDAISAVKEYLDSKGLYLNVELDPGLPQVYCDGMRIRQVIINLLSNASRFTEKGGISIRVGVGGDAVDVQVADTGPGIAPEDQEKVFEPFQQLDGSIRRRFGGSGLGLSISKRFVEMHGGKMWLESTVGVGTAFFFRLPVFTSPDIPGNVPRSARRWFNPFEAAEYRLRTRAYKAPAPSFVPRFVLLEKGKVLQRLFKRYMNDHEVAASPDLEGALAELKRSPAQAFIVNELSLEESFALKDNISRLPYGTPAVVCRVPGEDQVSSRLGIVRYLVKPVSKETLLAVLGELGEVKNILLVDDNREALRLFTRMMSTSDQGFTVIRATSGQRAVSLLKQRRPDVLLLDLVMPGMDGFQVLEAMRTDPDIRNIPVVIISSKDPSGEPIVSDSLMVSRSGGLSVRDLISCIQAVSETLNPSDRSADRARPEKPAV